MGVCGWSPGKDSTQSQESRRHWGKTYRIKKIIFERQPQVFVTAHLYIPAAGNPKARPPFPAVLAPVGHASNGKAYRNYQYAFQTLARLGYVVPAFDPFGQGEWNPYLDLRTGKSRLGPTSEHSQAGWPLSTAEFVQSP